MNVMHKQNKDLFPRAIGADEVNKLRRNEDLDIVRRLGFLQSERIIIKNHPTNRPFTIFNASIFVNSKKEMAWIYARIIHGYYMYVSSIAEIPIHLNDIYNGEIIEKNYEAHIVIYPSNKYDISGAEDPRVYMLDEDIYMTYTGRTLLYFSAEKYWKVVPVTAIYDRTNGKWIKKYIFMLDKNKFKTIEGDKDAFLHKIGNNVFFFHRPSIENVGDLLLISRTEIFRDRDKIAKEVYVRDSINLMEPASFEIKLGWATPPINISSTKVVALLHAVEREIAAYKVIAIEIELGKNEIVITAVTPRYIMVPKESYEMIGDRPFVVFPCGIWMLNNNELIIAYGAADTFVGIGIIDINDLLSELDKGRIY